MCDVRSSGARSAATCCGRGPSSVAAAADRLAAHLALAQGSMVNPVSLRRRGVIPTKSVPVTLDGYELVRNAGSAAWLPCAA